MCIYRSQTSAELKRTLVSMSEADVKMSFSESESITLKYPAEINNGNWHYVALILKDGKATLNVDASTTKDPKDFKTVDPL